MIAFGGNFSAEADGIHRFELAAGLAPREKLLLMKAKRKRATQEPAALDDAPPLPSKKVKTDPDGAVSWPGMLN